MSANNIWVGSWADAITEPSQKTDGRTVPVAYGAYITTEAAVNLTGGAKHLQTLLDRVGVGHVGNLARLASNAILQIARWDGNPAKPVYEVYSDARDPAYQRAEVNAALLVSARPSTYGFLKLIV